MRIRGDSRRIGVYSKTQEIQFKRARDFRGFGTGLEAEEPLQRAHGTVAIVCTKNETKIHHKRAQKRRDWIDSKAQRTQGGWGLLSQSNPIQSLTNPWTNTTLKRGTEGEEHRSGGLENRRVHEHITKASNDLTQVKWYLYPRDRSDRYAGPVRPVPGTGQTGWPAAPPVHDLIRRPRFFLRNEVFSTMPPS